jgi:hypothetical protein
MRNGPKKIKNVLLIEGISMGWGVREGFPLYFEELSVGCPSRTQENKQTYHIKDPRKVNEWGEPNFFDEWSDENN